MRQPIDEIDVILRQHDIIEVLMSIGYIEAHTEFFLFSSYHSSFESEEKEKYSTP
jgi:hypothetical protein